MLDVDFFKKINDAYGRAGGDLAEFHRQVDRQAHIGRPQQRDFAGGSFQCADLRLGKAGGGHPRRFRRRDRARRADGLPRGARRLATDGRPGVGTAGRSGGGRHAGPRRPRNAPSFRPWSPSRSHARSAPFVVPVPAHWETPGFARPWPVQPPSGRRPRFRRRGGEAIARRAIPRHPGWNLTTSCRSRHLRRVVEGPRRKNYPSPTIPSPAPFSGGSGERP